MIKVASAVLTNGPGEGMIQSENIARIMSMRYCPS